MVDQIQRDGHPEILVLAPEPGDPSLSPRVVELHQVHGGTFLVCRTTTARTRAASREDVIRWIYAQWFADITGAHHNAP